MKKFIYSWKTKRKIKNPPERMNVGFADVNSIGFLFNNKIEYQNTKPFINSLSNEGKKVTILILTNEKKSPDSKYLSKSECKWFGKIDSYVANKFIVTQFDYLFFLNKKSHFICEYILASSKAKCRVGLRNESKKHFFELMFDQDKNEPTESFYKTVKGYLEKIKS